MSRKFNTKKFIKDVLNDKYALVIGNEILLDTKTARSGALQAAYVRGAMDLCSKADEAIFDFMGFKPSSPLLSLTFFYS